MLTEMAGKLKERNVFFADVVQNTDSTGVFAKEPDNAAS
jgi:hypothetical protein